MSDNIFYPTIENEILMAATALWKKGVNGDSYICFLSDPDHDRLVEEFGKPKEALTFTRFTVNVKPTLHGTSFVSGDVHRVDLRFPLWPLS